MSLTRSCRTDGFFWTMKRKPFNRYQNISVRSPEEPDTERITRGSGMVCETMIFNIALVRRRIRDPGLRVEGFRRGRSKTDVAIMYIRDIASDKLVDEVRTGCRG